ncbi:MAG: ribosome-associated translation inhibitor RaiA [Bacteroidales bacterium]|nr:ribosome-associated translation inhibitor RaiA [Bacteroidales bacterium]
MNIKINTVRFSADRKLERFVQNKVKKLIQFYDDIIGAEVFLKLENTQDMDNKITEIRVDIPGNELFAKKQSKTFEESTDNAIDALKKQITKHKEKIRGL